MVEASALVTASFDGLSKVGILLGKTSGFEIWEFPKIGEPNKVPQIVGLLLRGPQHKVPLISETPIWGFSVWGLLGIALLAGIG